MLAWMPEGAWERFAGPVTRLTRLIPEDVLVGYHLCYGTFPEWPMYEARDMGLLVRMANFAVANSGRTVDWLHLACRTCAARTALSSVRWPTWSPATPVSSWASSCRSTERRACIAGTPPHRATSPALAWRCTAASAASPARMAPRPCGSTRVVRTVHGKQHP